MSRTIAVTNRKGGVGKSTISAHLAAGLATMGYNVGLIDTDSQGHSSLFFGMPKRDGLFDVLVNDTPLEDAVFYIPPAHYSTDTQPARGNLYLLPGSTRTAIASRSINPEDAFVLSDVITSLVDAGSLDYVVIDTQPSVSNLDMAIYLAVDGFLYVTEPEALSIDGIEVAITQLDKWSDTRERHMGRGIDIVGIQPNKLRSQTRLHRHNLQDVARGVDCSVWPPLLLRTVWGQAIQESQTLYTFAPDSPAAMEAWEMVSRADEVLRQWTA